MNVQNFRYIKSLTFLLQDAQNNLKLREITFRRNYIKRVENKFKIFNFFIYYNQYV